MSQEPSEPDKTAGADKRETSAAVQTERNAGLVAEKPPPPAAKSGKGSRIGAIIVLLLIVLSLRLVFHFGSPDTVYLASQGAGVRRTHSGRSSWHGAEGARQEQR